MSSQLIPLLAAQCWQIAALVVKHVVLVSITVLGIIVHRKYQRLYGIQR